MTKFLRLSVCAPLLLTGCLFSFDRTLSPGEISGVLVFLDSNGRQEPAAHATVSLENSLVSITADAQGSFAIAGLPAATYALRMTASTKGSGPVDVDVGVRITVNLADLSGTGGVDLGTVLLGSLGAIQGSVVTADGAALISGTAVLETLAETPLDSTGHFAFSNLLPDQGHPYLVSAQVTDAQGVFIATPVPVNLAPGQTVTLAPITVGQNIEGMTGGIQGVAVAAGAPDSEGIDVALSGLAADLSTSNAAGDYFSGAIPAGLYTVTASLNGFLPVSVPFVAIVPNATTDVPAILLPADNSACGLEGGPQRGESGVMCNVSDAGSDAGLDAGIDADAGVDAGTDAASDGGVDAGTVTGNWVNVTPATSPSGRAGQSMVYDSANSVSVLFGGQNVAGNDSGDTWEWDGTMWTPETPVTSPPGRWYAAMAYDSMRGASVLFGGETEASGYENETWEWNGVTWTEVNLCVGTICATTPSVRFAPAMAFDVARGVTVLFGGAGNSGPMYLNDTWEWNGTVWNQAMPLTSPPGRYEHSMAYDASRSVTVLFGGYNGADLSDTWEWDGTTWTQLLPTTSPPPLDGQGMAYDSSDAVTILFGGNSNTTWEWNGVSWAQLLPATSPPIREAFGIDYDSANDVTVLFSGLDFSTTTSMDDTWEFVVAP